MYLNIRVTDFEANSVLLKKEKNSYSKTVLNEMFYKQNTFIRLVHGLS